MRVVIVGNSAAALSAVEGFRRRDRDSRVTLVSAEAGPAYSRVLLPYYLRGRIPFAGLFIRDEGWYRQLAVETRFAVAADEVDLGRRAVRLSSGETLDFDRLLLATGARPFTPSIAGLEGPGLYRLHALDDGLALESFFRAGSRVLVLGSGFVALQAAWAAWVRGLEVTIYESAPYILPRVLDLEASQMLRARVERHGVRVGTDIHTEAVERGRDGSLCVFARGREPCLVDGVIVATGVRPNDDLVREALGCSGTTVARPGTPPAARASVSTAVASGLPGIHVAATMETALEGVFAAGDVARGPTAGEGPDEVHALWPTAVEHGRVAGANMAGAGVWYEGSLSMNVTEMFGATVASMGRFVASAGDDVFDAPDPAPDSCLRVVSRDGVPVGAISIGATEGATLLGRLRPYVRRRRPLHDVAGLFKDKELELLVGARPGTWPARGGPSTRQERARCA